MALNGLNIGRDATLDVIDPALGPLRFKIRTGYTVTPQYIDLSSKGQDGEKRNATIPDGHSIELSLDRGSGEADSYFANREAAYFNGIDIPPVSVTETIKEANGAVSQYRYTNGTIKQGATSWKGDTITTSGVTLNFTRKIKIA